MEHIPHLESAVKLCLSLKLKMFIDVKATNQFVSLSVQFCVCVYKKTMRASDQSAWRTYLSGCAHSCQNIPHVPRALSHGRCLLILSSGYLWGKSSFIAFSFPSSILSLIIDQRRNCRWNAPIRASSPATHGGRAFSRTKRCQHRTRRVASVMRVTSFVTE